MACGKFDLSIYEITYINMCFYAPYFKWNEIFILHEMRSIDAPFHLENSINWKESSMSIWKLPWNFPFQNWKFQLKYGIPFKIWNSFPEKLWNFPDIMWIFHLILGNSTSIRGNSISYLSKFGVLINLAKKRRF